MREEDVVEAGKPKTPKTKRSAAASGSKPSGKRGAAGKGPAAQSQGALRRRARSAAGRAVTGASAEDDPSGEARAPSLDEIEAEMSFDNEEAGDLAADLDDAPAPQESEIFGDAGGESLGVATRGERENAAGVTRGALVRVDPLSRYLAEVRSYPPLERDEELRLTRAFRATRDPEVATRLITANLVLVVKIARMFRRTVANVLDLIQEGNIGLLHALERFDPEVGVRFSTYASWWIKAYILKFLLDNVRMVRVGTTNARRKLLYNLHREKRRLESAGFTVGPKLLAEKFGVSERDVVEIEQSLAGRDVSLDAPAREEGSETRGDRFASQRPSVEDEVAQRELKELLDETLARFRRGLAERDLVILDTRLLSEEPATLQEIGNRFGITREAVRQAEKRLTTKLRSYLAAELGEQAIFHVRSFRRPTKR